MSADRVAVVTGASRGVGRGIAIALADSGFRVFATGRTVETAELPAGVTRLRCDHLRDEQTAAVFDRVRMEAGRIDILVNCAWGGYEQMVEDGKFTWTLPFHQQPAHRWTAMIDAGVRPAFVCSQHAARMMVGQGHGLIVNISFWAARKYVGNVIYGVAKAAVDKMTADMAHELRPHNIAVVSLYPGLVRTEAVMEAARQGWLDLSNSESPEFSGRVVAALYGDPNLMSRSGEVVIAADAALQYGFTDIDGRQPQPLRIENF
jgi:NAD(P)-dependent dehydrogenase (short-subunit alcohol dehydrogenase family)